MQKSALITGIFGQDGILMTEILLKKNYKVFGIYKNKKNISKIFKNCKLYKCDISNYRDLEKIIKKNKPQEIYNFASISRPINSWNNEEDYFKINLFGLLNLCKIIKRNNLNIKLFQSSSSEMYRNSRGKINNKTAFDAVNPYGISKISAHLISKLYRNTYNLKIYNGILFNHESEYRPNDFVSQKIAFGAACASLKIRNSKKKNEKGQPIVKNGYITLGNINIKRDWGYARDYMNIVWKIMNSEKPDDYIICSGKRHSIKDICRIAYSHVNLNWKKFVKVDKKYFRKNDDRKIIGNTKVFEKIKKNLNTITFEQMIKLMVNKQIEKLNEKKT